VEMQHWQCARVNYLAASHATSHSKRFRTARSPLQIIRTVNGKSAPSRA